MDNQHPKEICSQCNTPLGGPFCMNCGAQQQLKRINLQYIISEIGSVINFQKGIFFTIRELLIRPGASIHHFIHSDRNRLVKPIIFTIVCSLVYTLSQKLFHFEDGYVGHSFDNESSTLAIFNWISQNYGYANIIMALFIALWIKVFFRRYGYNYFEILILLFFMMGVGMLIFSFFGIIESITTFKIVDKGFLLGILYISWGIGQFFDKKRKRNYLYAFISYMLGMTSFSILAIALGSLLDWMNK